jgi:hypothetical protein
MEEVPTEWKPQFSDELEAMLNAAAGQAGNQAVNSVVSTCAVDPFQTPTLGTDFVVGEDIDVSFEAAMTNLWTTDNLNVLNGQPLSIEVAPSQLNGVPSNGMTGTNSIIQPLQPFQVVSYSSADFSALGLDVEFPGMKTLAAAFNATDGNASNSAIDVSMEQQPNTPQQPQPDKGKANSTPSPNKVQNGKVNKPTTSTLRRSARIESRTARYPQRRLHPAVIPGFKPSDQLSSSHRQ